MLIVAALAVALGSSRPAASGPVPLIAPAANAPRGAIYGGSTYFQTLSPSSAWLDSQMLLGPWLAQPSDAREVHDDVAMGSDIYWDLAGKPGKDVADYSVIRAAGMHVQAPSQDAGTGSETVGWQGSDEPDLSLGPGAGPWTRGAACSTATACGYTQADFYFSGDPSGVRGDHKLPYRLDGREVSSGMGKGVLFFETDAQAARFLRYSDILSADSYWLTDDGLIGWAPGACALLPHSDACGGGTGPGLTPRQARLPANYAYNVTRLAELEALNGPSKPIVVDVETGCPFAGSSAGNCATPRQSTAAAWHALIAGARGIIWFQHNFSGPCPDFRTFIDGSDPASRLNRCQQTPGVTLHDVVRAVTSFNDEIRALNGVLLAPTLGGYVRAAGVVAATTKADNGACYVIAGSGEPGMPPPRHQLVSFTLADGYSGPVRVYRERRSVQASAGVFRDTFENADSVHVYQIPDAVDCSGARAAGPSPLAGSPPPELGSAVPTSDQGPFLGSLAVLPGTLRAGHATISYSMSAAGEVDFVVERIRQGSLVAGRCVAGPARRARRSGCPQVSLVTGGFEQRATRGLDALRFPATVAGRKLTPGVYELFATPAAAPQNAASARFVITG